MKNNDNDRPSSSRESQPGIDSDSPEAIPRDELRRETLFTDFEDENDDSYEEPDRDTDYASGYREDSIDDDDFEDTLLEEDEDVIPPDQDEWPELRPARSWDESDLAADEEHDALWDESQPTEALQDNETDTANDREVGAGNPERRIDLQDDDDYAVEEDDSDWEDENDYPAEDTIPNQKWPLGLIAVAILALVLLAGGGYGVIQQRTETQQQIRQLQAALATAASPDEVAASRDALLKIKEENAELQANAEALTLYNRRLTDTVAGLESQLQAQEEAMAKMAATPQPATPQRDPKQAKPASAPAKAKKVPAKPQPAAAPAKTPVAASSGGPWFVNFASYGQQSVAQSWATKLKPVSGNVVVATSTKDGRTFYRVRIVELDSRAAADKVARQLESQHRLSKLWVGKQ